MAERAITPCPTLRWLVLWLALGTACVSLDRDAWERSVERAQLASAIGRHDLAEVELVDALGRAERLAARRPSAHGLRLAITLERLGAARAADGKQASAEQDLRRATTTWQAHDGDRAGRRALQLRLATLLVLRGRSADAAAIYDALVAERSDDPTADRRFHAESATAMAEASLAAGEPGAALGYLPPGIADAPGDVLLRAEAHAVRARALDAAGRADEARRVARHAQELVASTDYLETVEQEQLRVGGPLRWPDAAWPLRVRIPLPPGAGGAEAERLRSVVRLGVHSWRDAVRPGIPSFEFVESSREADVVFRWRRRREGLQLGATSFRSDPLRAQVELPVEVLGLPVPERKLLRVTSHEVGHALGLFGHSRARGDVMHAALTEEGDSSPSVRDLNTLRLLYGR